MDEIAEVPGIGPRTATAIVAALHQRRRPAPAVNMTTGEVLDDDRDAETQRRRATTRDTSTSEGGLETVVVTGLSGAGRSTAAKCFEDLGYYVVDNLPAELIATLMDLGSRSHGAVTRLAVVHGRAQPRVLQRPARRDPRPRRARHAARACCSSRPPTTCWCAASRACGAPTRCRATAG